jgi:hypothetical protein
VRTEELIMGLDDKVFSETNVEDQGGERNENLEGGKSSVVHKDEAHMEDRLTKRQEKQTEPTKDPDEIKAKSHLLPEDAERKADLSGGDSA